MHNITELIRYRAMFYSLVKSELRTRYKGSMLGFFWTFLNPFLMLVVYSIVFSTIMRINMEHYSAFLFIGLLSWNMFSTSVQSSSGVIIRQASLVKKIYFPRQILPLSIVGGSVVNYLLTYLILIPYLLVVGFEPKLTWLLVIPTIFMESILTAGIALFVSAVNVILRDVEHILSILLLAWFYVTPVVYSLNLVPEKYGLLAKLNPVSAPVMSFQDILYFGTTVHWKLYVYGFVIAIATFSIGWFTFLKLSKRFAEEV